MYIKIMHSPFPSFPQLLRDKLIPWASEGAAGRIIVARTQMQQAAMPAGVTLTQRPMRGKRVAVKGSRLYNKTPNVTARWPRMGMHEVGKPRLNVPSQVRDLVTGQILETKLMAGRKNVSIPLNDVDARLLEVTPL